MQKRIPPRPPRLPFGGGGWAGTLTYVIQSTRAALDALVILRAASGGPGVRGEGGCPGGFAARFQPTASPQTDEWLLLKPIAPTAFGGGRVVQEGGGGSEGSFFPSTTRGRAMGLTLRGGGGGHFPSRPARRPYQPEAHWPMVHVARAICAHWCSCSERQGPQNISTSHDSRKPLARRVVVQPHPKGTARRTANTPLWGGGGE